MKLVKESWPENLKEIKPEVKSLYYRGNLDLLLDKRPKLAVVGSRRMSEYGKRVIEKWMPELVRAGVVIVSGFMYGVDQTAHRECLLNGGQTIAVLGWGIDRRVTAEDEKLFQKILGAKGLVISEYEGAREAELWMFPQRNRIVAGICDAVLVIEAAEKSGSLITADWAIKLNKKLLAVPGRVDVSVAAGTNCLIKNGQAKMVSSAEEVLVEMSLIGDMKKKSKKENDPILLVLENGPLSMDELTRIMHLPIAELSQRLTILTLLGAVTESGGKYYGK